jgi:hypothetical protein
VHRTREESTTPVSVQIAFGISVVYLVGALLASLLGLELTLWLLRQTAPALLLVLPVLVAPELWRAIKRASGRR